MSRQKRVTAIKVGGRKYIVLVESRCRAKVNYWKYWREVGVKVDRRGRACSRFTVLWCGYCRRHCRELHGLEHHGKQTHRRGGRP